jgi:hypothetical protein
MKNTYTFSVLRPESAHPVLRDMQRKMNDDVMELLQRQCDLFSSTCKDHGFSRTQVYFLAIGALIGQIHGIATGPALIDHDLIDPMQGTLKECIKLMAMDVITLEKMKG